MCQTGHDTLSISGLLAHAEAQLRVGQVQGQHSGPSREWIDRTNRVGKGKAQGGGDIWRGSVIGLAKHKRALPRVGKASSIDR